MTELSLFETPRASAASKHNLYAFNEANSAGVKFALRQKRGNAQLSDQNLTEKAEKEIIKAFRRASLEVNATRLWPLVTGILSIGVMAFAATSLKQITDASLDFFLAGLVGSIASTAAAYDKLGSCYVYKMQHLHPEDKGCAITYTRAEKILERRMKKLTPKTLTY